jgi:hypothetical protein
VIPSLKLPIDYLYETLGPDKFQRLCQALLVKEISGIQCLPTGQKDGGRDAFLYEQADVPLLDVFQFKYTETPTRITDPVHWLESTIAGERSKIDALVSRGLRTYRIVTNVRGSAALDVGAIDRINQVLTSLPVPSNCLWRDDLDRRLDGAWDVKWSYPEVLTGKDLMAILVTSRISQDAERRSNAIKACLAEQYQRDLEVRFKQIDLQQRLLDLFVDVPLQLSEVRDARRGNSRRHWAVIEAVGRDTRDVVDPEFRDWTADELRPYRRSESTGAAALVLHELCSRELPAIVLEGAPGQGKSTIAQFVCQVHRMRILQRSGDLAGVPDAYLKGPLRMPIKIVLRDLAAWLGGVDPFTGRPASDFGLEQSAEGFACRQIAFYSGGAVFSIADLHAVAAHTPLLLAFDGLDEVADVAGRNQVIDSVSAMRRRMHEVAMDLQTLITSRPAAYSSTPGFSHEDFVYAQLGPLEPPQAGEYGKKWAHVRRLDETNTQQLLTRLKSCIREPHTRELSRNPMQLAILLALIDARGESLPDKRTELYRLYMDVFLTREAGKSELVKRHRVLLEELHGYIAWILHSESEGGRSRGSIAQARLIELLREYLRRQDRPPDIANQLFEGMVDRVAALVSRVTGIYEFEVQPLQEFFCAEYLYTTAPYSPAGRSRTGTLPERFNAIARNPFWLNVARFYAGCYSAGELDSLVSCLREWLSNSEDRLLAHPRLLGVLLLRDWVFSQRVPATNQVIDLLVDNLSLALVFNGPSRYEERIQELADDCGRLKLVERCKTLVSPGTPRDRLVETARVLRANSEPDELVEWWELNVSTAAPPHRAWWIRAGAIMGTLPKCSEAQLQALVDKAQASPQEIVELLSHPDVNRVLRSSTTIESAISAILDHRFFAPLPVKLSPHPLVRFGQVIEWLSRIEWGPRHLSGNVMEGLLDAGDNDILGRCLVVLRATNEALSGERPWNQLEFWNAILEPARLSFGERPAFTHLGLVAASKVITSRVRPHGASVLADTTVPLVSRARYARIRAGDASWWRQQLDTTTAARSETHIVLAALLAWGSRRVLEDVAREIARVAEGLAVEEFDLIMDSVVEVGKDAGESGSAIGFRSMSPELAVALNWRRGPEQRMSVYKARLRDYRGQSRLVRRFIGEARLDSVLAGSTRWRDELALYGEAHMFDGAAFGSGTTSHPAFRGRGRSALPYNVAAQIVADCDRFPQLLVWLASQAMSYQAQERTPRVAVTAENAHWFS